MGIKNDQLRKEASPVKEIILVLIALSVRPIFQTGDQ